MFRGATNINLDTKGRMAIPTRFRQPLQECCASQLVITADPDHCLLIYPLPAWEKVEQMLNNLPSLKPAARGLQRLMLGYASEAEMDAQGRVLIPPALRTHAGLDKHAILIGQGNKFELWDEERWNGHLAKWREETDLEQLELPAELGTLSF